VPRAKRKRNREGVYDRGDGWLWLQFGGKRSALGTRDWTEANELARKRKREAGEPRDPAVEAARLKTITEACAEFIEWAPTAANRSKPPSAATFEMYRSHLAHFLRLFGAESPVSGIDAAAVDRYIAARRSEPIGKAPEFGQPDRRRRVRATTVDKELGTLRQILRLGLRRGWYATPLERVLPEKAGGVYVPLSRALTLEQLPRLLEQLPEGRAATCAYIVALAADWCAVERAERFDCGDEAHASLLVLVRGTKNSKRWAEVPVVYPFGPYLERARAWLVEHGRFPTWGKQRCRDLAIACRRAGLSRITPRDLRRSHGQILAELGTPPYLIGEMLRHADSRQAERTYGQRTRSTVGRQVGAITSRAGIKQVHAEVQSTENRAKTAAE
jgi:integrase